MNNHIVSNRHYPTASSLHPELHSINIKEKYITAGNFQYVAPAINYIYSVIPEQSGIQ